MAWAARLVLVLACGCALGKVISVADLHGDFDRTVSILVSAGLIDKETHRWTGGDTTLVQTGDITDRGDQCKLIYELFFQLRQEAEKAGGRVINLLGNHEVMNMQGDWRYVTPGDVEAFGGAEERRKAWSKTGWLGSQLRDFPVAVVVERVLFVHAGLLPDMLEHRSLEELNVAFHSALDHASSHRKLLGGHGPVWARDYAFGSGACAMASEVLEKVGADRMVVGHTIQRDFHVHPRCNGKIVLADTAISSFYGGAMSFLEHEHGKVQVVYPETGEHMALPELMEDDAVAVPRMHIWPVAAVMTVLAVIIWKCLGCRKPRSI